jgi:hypothetical protein
LKSGFNEVRWLEKQDLRFRRRFKIHWRNLFSDRIAKSLFMKVAQVG